MMKFRLMLICLLKTAAFLLVFFCMPQVREIECIDSDSIKCDLTKALQNPSKVLIIDLSNHNLATLPKEIGQLKNLQGLDLSGNQLIILPKEIGQLQNLQGLDLSMNQLSTLPEEIVQLQNLQLLNLRNNPFSPEEKDKIRKLLPKCKIHFD